MRRYILLLFMIMTSILGLRSAYVGKALWVNWQKENFWLKKANTTDSFDLLFLGDSRTYHAINPAFFLTDKKKRAINFAFPSMSYTPYYIQKAKRIFAQRSSVVLGLSAESLTQFETDKSLRNYERQGPLWTHQSLALIRAFWPQINLQDVLKWGRVPWGRLLPAQESDHYHASGWVEGLSPVQKDFEAMARHYRELAQRYQIDKAMIDHLVKEVASWTQNGHKVYFFWACFEDFVCKEEERILDSKLRSEIGHQLVTSGASELSFSGIYGTFDGDHLTGTEALRFSEDLSRVYLKN